MLDLDEIQEGIQQRALSLERKIGQRDALQDRQKELQDQKKKLEQRRTVIDESRVLLRTASEKARELSRGSLEAIVTEALQEVFGPNIFCEIEFRETKAGKPEAELYITSDTPDGQVRVRPEDGRGGGVVDVVALAARLAEIELFSDPELQGSIWLDEPAKHLASSEYRQALAGFISKYAQQFQRQVIMITQHEETTHAADKAFYAAQIDGVTTIEEVSKGSDTDAV